jgi:prevent-host-death family protein
MDDQTFNIAEAKMHLSRLIERVERGEQITIARNGKPVALVSPILASPNDIVARIDAVREQIAAHNGGRRVRRDGESWRELIDEGRRI